MKKQSKNYALALNKLLQTSILSPKIVNFCLKKGANPNITDKRGWTVLMHAAFKGQAEVVKLLISKGANVIPRIRPAQQLL